MSDLTCTTCCRSATGHCPKQSKKKGRVEDYLLSHCECPPLVCAVYAALRRWGCSPKTAAAALIGQKGAAAAAAGAACRHSGVVGRITDPVELQAAQMRAEALLADKQALARRHATMTE